MTVAEYAASYLATIRPLVRPQTFRSYEWALRCYVVPVLGARRIADIQRADVRAFSRDIVAAGRLSRTTVRLVMQILRGLFSAAVEDERIAVNPARRPTKMLRLGPGAIRPALYGADLARFLDAARRMAPHMMALFLVLARTGLRLGEALGLTWQHVDLEERVAYVCQQPWPGQKIGPTKNGRAHWVDLSAQCIGALRVQRSRMAGPWVFPGPSGFPYSRSTVHHHFRRAAALAGLPAGLSPHSFRHGYASVLLTRGEPLAYVAAQLDHGDPKLTTALYGSHLRFHRLAAVDGLDDG